MFEKECDFEEALIEILITKGWESNILKYRTEKDLINNWANILFENNRGIDRLNNIPLTDGEMKQIIDQIINLRTPLKLNGFINGKTVAITRDNPDDKEHFGKEISLKIYDRNEIAGGSSRYQIAQQPQFIRKSKILNDRRGDLMLLINGMPLIHIELKKSGIPVSQAYYQIEKYSNEGVFSNLFLLIQVFVAMTPEETVYFANPGADGIFNKDYYFHWADFNNEKINDWKDIASSLLSIPMAHQLIGFYTVADDSDGVLKVMRSYQYYAANAISDKISKVHWDEENLYGGYVWHTTGSGKTMTSFKSAQLISDSKDADKVIFLMDRIELGTQSLTEYRGFANDNEDIQATEDTGVLVTKLKSSDPSNTLIVTSIQKMSNIKKDAHGLNDKDIKLMQSKRIVFIIDEAHRSTFGEMLTIIKNTFSSAVFFGFTGTPIQKENQKKMNDTSTIFGNELHRYSIADGIRDKNVLGFDIYQIKTFRDNDLRKAVALEKAKAKDEKEALNNEKKKKVYLYYMNPSKVKMAGYYDSNKKYLKGIEDILPKSQYRTEEHQKQVVEDIVRNWITLSQNGKFHAIFATSSISEAIEYYRLIKRLNSGLKITALFDPNIDNNDGDTFKELGLIEIIDDYNRQYEQKFDMGSFHKFKKDIAARLAHKEPYKFIERTPDKQINLLIVVDQMLTGFDSKWINTLYLDKNLEYENIIQAFSRTNRLFGPDKPFGTIKYYRRPNTMKRNIEAAIKLYSGEKPFGLFVPKLKENLNKLNFIFREIKELFVNAGILNFEKLPEGISECKKFASLFKELNQYLEAVKIQGFTFEKNEYKFQSELTNEKSVVKVEFDEQTYLILAKRYKELSTTGGNSFSGEDIPYDIEGYLTEIDTGIIDAEYMNTNFKKYMKLIKVEGASKDLKEQVLNELHKSFASLSQEEQKYATIFLHDVQSGNVKVNENKTLRDYITQYQLKAKNDRIHQVAVNFGLNEKLLRKFMGLKITAANINEYGRFDELKISVDKAKAKAYFEKLDSTTIPIFKVNIKVDKFLRDFILNGGQNI